MKTIGILGSGQLGRMLALAGYPLGLRFKIFSPEEDSPAGQVAPHVTGSYEDPKALEKFADGLDAATYEFENVPGITTRVLAKKTSVHPPSEALETAQDRLNEKTFFQKLGIPTAPFVRVDSREDLEKAVQQIGLPAVLKTRRLGYDGKGQFVLLKPEDIGKAWGELGQAPLELEGFVPYERELSVLAVRNREGETAFYPLVQNYHEGGILRLSLAPAPGADLALQAQAEDYAVRVLKALNYVGVLAIEFFQQGGKLLANEMACRVHNSGHWTIEGAEASQFENHVRAVAGLPLGSTAPVGHSVMINLIGDIPNPEKVTQVPGAHLHLYGKEPRPGRKVGHVTLRADDKTLLKNRLAALHQDLFGKPPAISF